MSKFGLHSDKPPIAFDSHLTDLDGETRAILIKLRNYVLSLGDKVVEEVRPHRIVYAKSLTFRYFLDIYPSRGDLTVAVRKNRKDPAEEHIIKSMKDLEIIEPKIETAFKEI